MKTFVITLVSALLLGSVSVYAAIPTALNSSDYITPEDSLSATSRGSVKVCGNGSRSFMQLENAACPVEPRKAIGWDRPQAEPVSPGVPFQNQGIERY